MKRHEEWKLIPFIVVTSKTSKSYLLDAILAGADDFVTKDLACEIINAKIEAMLRLSALQRQVAEVERQIGVRQMVVTYNHEFNNPLFIASMAVERLQKIATGEQKELVGKIEEQLARMTDITKRIAKVTEDTKVVEYPRGNKMVDIG